MTTVRNDRSREDIPTMHDMQSNGLDYQSAVTLGAHLPVGQTSLVSVVPYAIIP